MIRQDTVVRVARRIRDDDDDSGTTIWYNYPSPRVSRSAPWLLTPTATGVTRVPWTRTKRTRARNTEVPTTMSR